MNGFVRILKEILELAQLLSFIHFQWLFLLLEFVYCFILVDFIRACGKVPCVIFVFQA